jgi:hypothetical protein
MKAEIGLCLYLIRRKQWSARGTGTYRTIEVLRACEVLVKDLNSVIAKGLEADIGPTDGRTAPKVCQHLFQVAQENASKAEKKYLPIVKRRIDSGSLSERIHERVEKKA